MSLYVLVKDGQYLEKRTFNGFFDLWSYTENCYKALTFSNEELATEYAKQNPKAKLQVLKAL